MLTVCKVAEGEGGIAVLEGEPREPGPGEVMIKVSAAGICGTDMQIYYWAPRMARRMTLPRVLGHEACGIVTAVGPDVSSPAIGDFVSLESHVFCGTCRPCRLGNAHLYADPFLPDDAVRYAGGTSFVAKSAFLRWVSELGVISLAVFLIWWARAVGRTARMHAYRAETVAQGGIVQRAGWSLLAFWLVSGYVTPQFFLLTGIVLVLNQVLRVSVGTELYRLRPHWSERGPQALIRSE